MHSRFRDAFRLLLAGVLFVASWLALLWVIGLTEVTR
jgi:hypothetical protein